MPGLIARTARLVMRSYPFPRGQGRIVDRTPLTRLRFLEQRLLVRTVDGFTMEVFPNDHIGRHLYLTGQFDRTIVEALLRFARPGDRGLDIGSNVGYVACALLHLVPESRVVCVEPQAAVHELLTANLERLAGRGARARALRVAVSDAAGWGSMAPFPGNTGASRLLSGAEGSLNGDRVEVVTGATLMERSGLDRLNLVKIDVEGLEEAVVRTLSPVLARWRPRAVVFEHTGDLADPASGLARVFRELDYAVLGIVKRLARFELVPVPRLAAAGRRAHDYVAAPAETESPRHVN
jgi:FkbM family methyltransferase